MRKRRTSSRAIAAKSPACEVGARRRRTGARARTVKLPRSGVGATPAPGRALQSMEGSGEGSTESCPEPNQPAALMSAVLSQSATAAAASAATPYLSVNSIEVIYDHVILVLKGVSLEVPE